MMKHRGFVGGKLTTCGLTFVAFLVSNSSYAASTSDAAEGQALPKSKCVSKDFKNRKSVKGEIVRVSDGDTVHLVTRGKRYAIRMLSMDTPETQYMGKAQPKWGDRATKQLKKLLPLGTKVRLELDVEKCDKYGRLLGHVWKGRTNINLEMIKSGLAVNYCIWPNLKHCAEYGEEAQKNYDDGVGVFSDKKFEVPYEWRRRVSGRKHTKFVGDVYLHDVYPPGSNDYFDLGARVFFFNKSDIKKPFYLVEDN